MRRRRSYARDGVEVASGVIGNDPPIDRVESLRALAVFRLERLDAAIASGKLDAVTLRRVQLVAAEWREALASRWST